MYEERRPRRIIFSQGWESTRQQQRLSPAPLPTTDWGIHRVPLVALPGHQQPQTRTITPYGDTTTTTTTMTTTPPSFPATVDALTDDLVAAIRGTLFHTAKLDPHIVHNAVWPAHRPVRRACDVGRLGIELDGVRTLFLTTTTTGAAGGVHLHPRHEQAAVRRVTLGLANKLSQQDWTSRKAVATSSSSFQTTKKKHSTVSSSSATSSTGATSPSPVAVYFNSLQQALAATQDLARLRRNVSSNTAKAYDHISIHVLTDPDCDVPSRMKQRSSSSLLFGGDCEDTTDVSSSSSSSSSSLPASSEPPAPQEAIPGAKRKVGRPRKQPSPQKEFGKSVYPEHGIILIVQPTDAVDVSEVEAASTTTTTTPPMIPALGTITALQKLIARATLYELPVVLVSPRLSRLTGTLWDQSGYQQSATYGGMEPPRGPTPWMLRDFIPPVYSWIVVPNVYHPAAATAAAAGEADNSCGSSWRAQVPSRQSPPPPHWQCDDEDRSPTFVSYTGGCSMVQSVMHDRHSWHVFANVIHQHNDKKDQQYQRQYEYLASTKSSTGRPTRDVLRRLLEEFSEHSLGWRDESHD